MKHNGPLTGPKAARHERAPVPDSILAYCAKQDLELATFASIEAQAAALADDIAYNNHDIDDGFRAGLFTFAELGDVPIAARALATSARRLSRHRRHAAPLRSHPPPHHLDDRRRGCRERAASRRARAPKRRRRAPCRRPPRSPSRRRCRAISTGSALFSRPKSTAIRASPASCGMRRAWSATCSSATATTPRRCPRMARAGAAARHAGPCPPYLRFHRRHDRPLCAGRASPLV